jgi:hypothetical protein
MSNPQSGGPPIFSYPRLLIQYIRSYPPYLEAVSSIRNLRTRHAVVTRHPVEGSCEHGNEPSFSLFPVAPTLEHRTPVKRFVSLQFLNPKTVGRTPLMGVQPIARPLPIQTQNKHRQTSMPWVGFEPTIPAFDRAKTIHALDRAATVFGLMNLGVP